MKVCKVALTELSQNYYLRLDYKINVYNTFIKKQYKNKWKIKDFLRILRFNQIEPENFEQGYLIELGHVRTGIAGLNGVLKVNSIGSSKVVLNSANFAYSKLETGKGYFISIPEDIPNYDENSLIVASTELVPCKVRIDNKIAKYYLAHFKQIFDMFLSGKTHRRIQGIEFLNIELPRIEINEEQIKHITDIENKIKRLKVQIKETTTIVDEIFNKYFKLNLKQYSVLEKKHIFGETLLGLSKSLQLRSSVNFYLPKYNSVINMLKAHKTFRLKQLLRGPIRRGVQPEYSESRGVLVIKTINISKAGNIDLTESSFVGENFYNKVKKYAGIQKGDVLITSTGEGRGKVCLYDLDEPAIADTHISILKCKDEVNPKYLSYFLLSTLGKIQLSLTEQAVKGTPEMYPKEMEKLIIIYPSHEIQDKIVKEIEINLEKQKEIYTEIELLKQEIDNLITQAILQ